MYLVVKNGDISDRIKGRKDIDYLRQGKDFMHIGENGSLEENVLVHIGL